MERIFLTALAIPLLASLLLLAYPAPLLILLGLSTGLVLLVLSILKDHARIIWLPLYTLAAEMQLFYSTANGLLLLFYYVLLLVNLAAVFLKRNDWQQMALAAFWGKLAFLTMQALNLYLFFQGVPGPFLGLAYSMTVITSIYLVAWLYGQIDRPGMTPARFLIPTLLSVIPVIDLILAGRLAWQTRKELYARKTS